MDIMPEILDVLRFYLLLGLVYFAYRFGQYVSEVSKSRTKPYFIAFGAVLIVGVLIAFAPFIPGTENVEGGMPLGLEEGEGWLDMVFSGLKMIAFLLPAAFYGVYRVNEYGPPDNVG